MLRSWTFAYKSRSPETVNAGRLGVARTTAAPGGLGTMARPSAPKLWDVARTRFNEVPAAVARSGTE